MNTKISPFFIAVGQVAGLLLLGYFLSGPILIWTLGITAGTWVGFTFRGYLDRRGLLR